MSTAWIETDWVSSDGKQHRRTGRSNRAKANSTTLKAEGWEISGYYVGHREPDVKEKKIYKKFKNLDLARSYKIEIDRQLQIGTYIPQADRQEKLDSYVERLFESALNLAPSTLAGHRDTWKNHLQKPLGKRPIGSVTARELQTLVTKLVNDGVGNGTLATIRQLLSKIFNQAHAEGLIPRKITPDLNFPKERPSKLSKKTVKGWQDAIQPLAGAIEPRYQPAFYLAAILGLRAGEIGGLRVEDVDYTENEIEVKQAVRTVKGRAQLADTKTEQGERTIPVPSYLMDAITTHMREFPPASDGRIFTAPLAEPNYVSHLTLNKAFQKAIKATGLPPMRFHDLRHLAISTMLMLGIQPNVVKERAGHRTLAITMDRYGHLLPEQDRDAADKLENYLLTKGVMSVALPEVSVS